MKKSYYVVLALLLVASLLIGCNSTPEIAVNGTEDTKVENPSEPTEASGTEAAPTETEDTEYEGDATSYYIDRVYTEQIERYHTAISQQWEEGDYYEHEMSPMVVSYYDGKALDNVGFTFMDLDGDGLWELIIGAIKNAERDPLIFEIWTLKDGEPVMLAQSGYHNRYYLQYAQEDNLWSVAYEAENGMANHAVYYLQLLEGEFQVVQGIVFDALADENNPWFMTYDLDWDVSNDTPIDEKTANAVRTAGRNNYAAQEYFPYSLYN